MPKIRNFDAITIAEIARVLNKPYREIYNLSFDPAFPRKPWGREAMFRWLADRGAIARDEAMKHIVAARLEKEKARKDLRNYNSMIQKQRRAALRGAK